VPVWEGGGSGPLLRATRPFLGDSPDVVRHRRQSCRRDLFIPSFPAPVGPNVVSRIINGGAPATSCACDDADDGVPIIRNQSHALCHGSAHS
jgi:hypothetical protein